MDIVTNKGMLKRKCINIPVDWFENGQAKELDTKLRDTLKDAKIELHRKPLGLSAPQIDQTYCMCIIKGIFGYDTIVNPVITSSNGDSAITTYETCLSFPGQCFKARRYNDICVRYLDIKGKVHERNFKGLRARELQHEIDHMLGIVPTKQQFEDGAVILAAKQRKKEKKK